MFDPIDDVERVFAVAHHHDAADSDAFTVQIGLASGHPGHTADEIVEMTGFDFDRPDTVPETPASDVATLALIRGRVAAEIAETYPAFAARVFGNAASAA